MKETILAVFGASYLVMPYSSLASAQNQVPIQKKF
jgi:hypothetical protein